MIDIDVTGEKKMGRITAITAGKGGMGKTMFAVNLASCLAMKGETTLLIDMNSGFRNLDICLGLENQVIYDIEDIIGGICTIGKALIRDRRFPALYLLSASQNPDKAEILPSHMERLCEKLSRKFDHIIIDTPSCTGRDWEASVASADSAVIVTTQEYVSLRDSDSLERKLIKNRVPDSCAVINRVKAGYDKSSLFPPISEMAEALRCPVAGIIQEDENIHIAMNSGVPVVCKKDSYVMRNFMNILGRLFPEEAAAE